MNPAGPKFDQLNIVSGDLEASIAFYRRLGAEIPEESVWRTATGIHHVNAGGTDNSRSRPRQHRLCPSLE
jgi:catechol 2,3-dioxygenase-like lactoylglutathione lyase family enzyme